MVRHPPDGGARKHSAQHGRRFHGLDIGERMRSLYWILVGVELIVALWIWHRCGFANLLIACLLILLVAIRVNVGRYYRETQRGA